MCLLNGIETSHPELYTKYKLSEKALTMDLVVQDLNHLHRDENRQSALGLLSKPPGAPPVQKQPQNKPTNVSEDANPPAKARDGSRGGGRGRDDDEKPLCSTCNDYYWVNADKTCWKVFPEQIPRDYPYYARIKAYAEKFLSTEEGKRAREKALRLLDNGGSGPSKNQRRRQNKAKHKADEADDDAVAMSLLDQG
ncbi:hypothetical protein IMZ48_29570 [Candidatus Bathyarchaeota archaeon]|nr:hypothetical protein [Candidatus Bathyarchaeota archaeon]